MSTAAAALAERARGGDRRALGRLLTLIDDDAPGARDATAGLAAHGGQAWVVGITGVPGSGKSTLINAMLGAWLDEGRTVAVVAVDPSSPVSGGAVLGDRIRMGAHAADERVFVRSFSARGELGGLSRSARAAVDAFDVCGFDRIVVETVGTGQSETAIVALADTRVVVCPPGLGDDVQAIKAGTLEIADVFAVSKGDLPLAAQTARELRDMLLLRPRPKGAWHPQAVVVSGLDGSGVHDLLAALDAHRAKFGVGRRRAAERPTAPAARPSLDDAGWRARIAELASRDGLCATLGIVARDGGPGRAEVAMTVEARHLNFNGGCHGGAIFALADSAFGLASNSHGPLAAGIDAHITYQAAVREGDTLVARAAEVHRNRRIGVYRIDVVREQAAGETAVSSFTGTVYIRSD